MRLTKWISMVLLILIVAAPGSASSAGERAKPVFAGGCFWSMELAFEKVEGVLSATSGFMGGSKAKPTYDEVSAGGTGHAEAVEVVYDPAKISYQKLLDHYWKNIDPLTPNGQFCDFGAQYRTVIFYGNDEEKRQAEASKRSIEQSGRFTKAIVTQVERASQFYAAEDYHQDFAANNPVRYGLYKAACGRADRLEQLWGKS
ncbi:MAG TPA: peptide-methionine (S)-S-oxide reductase MsrA [Nitrospira sp.]|nr:peptide-methionine (S)-S-oxide reductase MsrA [Nitrospira sp.]